MENSDSLSNKTDSQILEILVDKSGWREDVFNEAKLEAKKRGLSVGKGSEKEIVNQAKILRDGLLRDLKYKESPKSLIVKLMDAGLPEEMAKLTVKQTAIEFGASQRKSAGYRFGRYFLVLGFGGIISLKSYMEANSGTGFYVGWMSIIVGSIKTILSFQDIKKWDRFNQNANEL